MKSATSTVGDHPAKYDVLDFYITYHAPLRGWLMKKGFRYEEAEEKVQEAFCRFLAFLKNNEEKYIENPRAYLKQIINNVIKDEFKRRKLHLMDSIDDEDHPIDLSDRGLPIVLRDNYLDKKEQFEKVVLPFTEGFSRYELRLSWLIRIEEYTAYDIAAYLEIDYEEAKIDSNRVRAKLNYRLKHQVKKTKNPRS